MTDLEYREFLTFLFERYVRPRIPRIRHRFHHHMMEEWYYHLDQAARAAHVLRFIESYCDDDDDVYRTFTAERLARAVSDARYAFDFSNRTIEEAGFLDAFEAHAKQILDHLQPSHLPDAEKEVLKDMGSLNPEVEIRALVFEAKASWKRVEQKTMEISVRQQLRNAEQRLKEAEHEFEERKSEEKEGLPKEAAKKSRRWFKGLGQIAQGSAFSIADVALAVGALKFPVSPETQTWGAVASVSTGIGAILSGIGDLRSE
jgi:hypothetical protein